MTVAKRDLIPWTPDDVEIWIADYPADLKEPLLEVARYADDRLHGNPDALIDLLTTDSAPDWTTVTRLFQGKWDNPRRLVETRVIPALKLIKQDAAGYVDTPVSRQIRKCLDMWSDMHTMAEIVGPAGRSKSFTAYEWHLDNPFSIYIDCPAVGGVGAFLREFAREIKIGMNQSLDNLAASIEEKVDKRNVVLVDEVARILPATGNPHSAGVKSLNFLQRLHDRQKVTVIFIATDIFDTTFNDCRLVKYLAQLHRRIKYRYETPAVNAREVAAIVKAFNPDPGRDLLQAAYDMGSGPDGIGPLFTYLHNAKLLADRREEPVMLWHFQEASEFSRVKRAKAS